MKPLGNTEFMHRSSTIAPRRDIQEWGNGYMYIWECKGTLIIIGNLQQE